MTKKTFDDVLKWGFGRTTPLREEDIRKASREAFELLSQGEQSAAVRRLCELHGVGVSRATKVLALSDQRNLGIYDSRAASALNRYAAAPMVPVPPGRSKALQGAKAVSPERLVQAYPKYNAALRRLLENAQQDSRYGHYFRRVADVERALFSSSQAENRPATKIGQLAPRTGLTSRTRESGRAALLGAMPGAIVDARSVIRGELPVREFTLRRFREAGLAGLSHAVTSQVGRIGKATAGAKAHLQGGARAATVGVVVGGQPNCQASSAEIWIRETMSKTGR